MCVTLDDCPHIPADTAKQEEKWVMDEWSINQVADVFGAIGAEPHTNCGYRYESNGAMVCNSTTNTDDNSPRRCLKEHCKWAVTPTISAEQSKS